MPRFALLVMTSINLLNYVDRYLISSLMPSIRSEIPMTDDQAGLIGSAFMLGYFLTSPIFGFLADRINRSRIIFVGTVAWSVITAVSGYANSFLHMLLLRAGVGVGEASTVSTSQALLTDFYPKEQRNKIIGIFTSAIPLGGGLGFVVGGVLGQRFGWRNAFMICGIPGIILAFLTLLIKDPARGGMDRETVGSEKPGLLWADIKILLLNKPFMRIVLGYSAYTFCLGGFAFWAPQYLVYIRNMSIEQAGLWMGAITVSTGFIGTLAGGYGSNYFAKKFKGGDMWFCFWVTVIATPITFLAFSFSRPEIFLSFFVLAQLFLFASQPAVNVACITVVSPFLRSTALAFMVFMIHALGDLLSPTMVGYASRYSNLNVAVFILPFALIPCSYYYYRSYRDLS